MKKDEKRAQIEKIKIFYFQKTHSIKLILIFLNVIHTFKSKESIVFDEIKTLCLTKNQKEIISAENNEIMIEVSAEKKSNSTIKDMHEKLKSFYTEIIHTKDIKTVLNIKMEVSSLSSDSLFCLKNTLNDLINILMSKKNYNNKVYYKTDSIYYKICIYRKNIDVFKILEYEMIDKKVTNDPVINEYLFIINDNFDVSTLERFFDFFIINASVNRFKNSAYSCFIFDKYNNFSLNTLVNFKSECLINNLYYSINCARLENNGKLGSYFLCSNKNLHDCIKDEKLDPYYRLRECYVLNNKKMLNYESFRYSNNQVSLKMWKNKRKNEIYIKFCFFYLESYKNSRNIVIYLYKKNRKMSNGNSFFTVNLFGNFNSFDVMSKKYLYWIQVKNKCKKEEIIKKENFDKYLFFITQIKSIFASGSMTWLPRYVNLEEISLLQTPFLFSKIGYFIFEKDRKSKSCIKMLKHICKRINLKKKYLHKIKFYCMKKNNKHKFELDTKKHRKILENLAVDPMNIIFHKKNYIEIDEKVKTNHEKYIFDLNNYNVLAFFEYKPGKFCFFFFQKIYFYKFNFFKLLKMIIIDLVDPGITNYIIDTYDKKNISAPIDDVILLKNQYIQTLCENTYILKFESIIRSNIQLEFYQYFEKCMDILREKCSNNFSVRFEAQDLFYGIISLHKTKSIITDYIFVIIEEISNKAKQYIKVDVSYKQIL